MTKRARQMKPDSHSMAQAKFSGQQKWLSGLPPGLGYDEARAPNEARQPLHGASKIFRPAKMAVWVASWSGLPPAGLPPVPTLVRYEVSRHALVNGGAAARVLALRAMAKFQSVDFSVDLADRAESLAHDHKLVTADAIIYATALHHDAELWTQDAHFKGLAGVRYFGKTLK